MFISLSKILYLVVERRRDGRVVEDGCKVGAACCQHETVRFEGLTCRQKRVAFRALTEFAKKVCPAPAGGIMQPRTHFFGQLCSPTNISLVFFTTKCNPDHRLQKCNVFPLISGERLR